MRIALIAANREQKPEPVVPLGLLYVRAAIPERHEVQIWDLCFENDPLETVTARLGDFTPEFIGVGTRNIQNASYSDPYANLDFYGELVRAARQSSDATVVIGGSALTCQPMAVMRTTGADYGVVGEGERAMAQLCTQMEAGQIVPQSIGALCYWEGGEIRLVDRGAPAALAELRAPSRRWVDDAYYRISGCDSVQTKRGCPLSCKYCTYPIIEGRTSRCREPAAVVDEMLQALRERPEIEHFFIVDAVFNQPPSHAKAVCQQMLRQGMTTPWTCYVNPLGFDAEMAVLMRKAGCSGVEIGTDTGTDVGLKRLGKGFTTDDVLRAHQYCLEAGLPDCHTFMLATPAESVAEAEQTLDFCRQLDPFAAVFMIYSEDRELRAEQHPCEISETVREQIVERLREVALEQPYWSVPGLQIRFSDRLFGALRRQGVKGPLWRHVRSF